MKKGIFLLLALCSCGISEMNKNMEQTNTLMVENTHTMQNASSTIAENTSEVSRSTETMKDFEKIIAENTLVFQKLFDHPRLMQLIVFLCIILLVLPSILLIIIYKKIKRP